MAKTKPFYVYRILGEQGETVYIGKGTGRRLADQKRRFMADGEIIAEFTSERAAFGHEKRLIAKENPPLNRCGGGGGGIFGRSNPAIYKEEMLWETVARAIRALRVPQAHFRYFDMKPALEKFVQAMVVKYGPETFAERLSTYNIKVLTN